MKKALNAKVLESFGKPSKRLVFGDMAAKNLLVMIQPSGKIFWVWQGRVDGETRQVRLGQYPVMGIAAARKATAQITEDRDLAKMKEERFDVPRKIKRTRVAKPSQHTIEHTRPTDRDLNWLWDEYLRRDGGGKPATVKAKNAMYDNEVRSKLGHIPYAHITFKELAKLVAEKAETAPGASNHLVSYLKRLFRWAVTKGHAYTDLSIDPAANLVQLGEKNAVDRWLSNQEIVWFFKAALAIDNTFSHALIHTLYNGTRKTETFEMPWKEYDEARGHWLIPKERAKNNNPLLLPQAPSAQALLKRRKEICGKGTYVFPSNKGDKPIGGFSKAMAEFRAKIEEFAAEESCEVPNWTIHDLRRTLSTGMNDLTDAKGDPMIPGDIVERVLNHQLGKVRGTYNHAEYLSQKRRALELWNDHLDALRARAQQPVMKKAA